MHRDTILKQLSEYKNGKFIMEEELPFMERFIDFVANNPFCFERSIRSHVTGSVWLVNHDFSQALLTHHRKLNIWVQLGGHADGDSDIKRVALKEAREESGIQDLEFVHPGIFDIDIHLLPSTSSCDFHYDMRYLLQAPAQAVFTVSEESHGLAWIEVGKLQDYTQERSVLRLAEKIDRIER